MESSTNGKTSFSDIDQSKTEACKFCGQQKNVWADDGNICIPCYLNILNETAPQRVYTAEQQIIIDELF